jgi:hypothetical protein
LKCGFFGHKRPPYHVNYTVEWAISWKPSLYTKDNTISISGVVCILREKTNSPAVVKIYSCKGNQQITNALGKQVGISEAARPLTSSMKNTHCYDDFYWNQWLAGLIDGDGFIGLSRFGYACLEITMDLKDEHALQQIKQKLGGSVKVRAGSNSVRYRLHNKKGILDLISRINGNIRNSVRVEQLKKICNQYNIEFIEPSRITSESIHNGWFAGFFDADGTITFSMESNVPQLTISVTNKKEKDVLFFKKVFGGNIYLDKAQNQYFKWSIQSQKDVLNMLEYFKNYPSRSSKNKRLHLVPLYYSLKRMKAYKALKNEALFKEWQRLKKKWNERC